MKTRRNHRMLSILINSIYLPKDTGELRIEITACTGKAARQPEWSGRRITAARGDTRPYRINIPPTAPFWPLLAQD